MATLEKLVVDGRLEEVEDISLSGAQKRRQLHIMVPEASDDLFRVIGENAATWNPSLSVEDQVIQLIHDFFSGKCLHHPEEFHVLNSIDDGIWELKTADVRLFGWFLSRDHFIIASAGFANKVKTGQYSSFVSTAKFRRRDLSLEDGKFVAGEEPGNVISYFHTT